MPESRTPRHNAIFEQLHIWRKPSACHHLVPNYMLSLSSCFCHNSVFCSEAAGSLQMLLMIQSAFWLSKRNKHHDLFHQMFKLFWGASNFFNRFLFCRSKVYPYQQWTDPCFQSSGFWFSFNTHFSQFGNKFKHPATISLLFQYLFCSHFQLFS